MNYASGWIEIHEYIADMYITHDEERSRLKCA